MMMRSRSRRRAAFGASLVGTALSGALLTAGCAQEVGSRETADAETTPSVQPLPTLSLAPPAVDLPRSFSTHLYSERDADVYSRLFVQDDAGVGTPIASIRVEIGDRVAEGEILATLESSDAALQVEAAEPEAEIARSNLERVQELAATGAVSRVELEDALLRSRTADAALARARLNLSRTQVRAPFAGVVARRYARVGDMVDNRTPLFRITALSPLRARLLVPEADMAGFTPGSRVRLTGVDGSVGTARVILVGPTTDPGSATREVVVELAETGDFRPGASATAELAGS